MKRLSSLIAILFLTVLVILPCQAQSAAIDREQEVRDAVTQFVKNRTAGMGWDVRIRRIVITAALKLPGGAIDYEVIAPQQWEGWGSIRVAVIARQKDRVVNNIPVQLDVEALIDTVITLRQIEHGTIVSPADLVLQKREITQNSHLAARTLDEVVGKKARMALRANQPVRADQVERVPLISSGQMVTIIAESGTLKVSVAGKARSSGVEGDMIRVQNLTSLKEITARIIDSSTVQVPF